MMCEDTAGQVAADLMDADLMAADLMDVDLMDADLLDIDAIAAEVAAEVGLAEGTAGVRDILRLIMLAEPVPTGQLSRQAELPVPIVTAVCNELRKLSVVDRSRPVRLTERARAA